MTAEEPAVPARRGAPLHAAAQGESGPTAPLGRRKEPTAPRTDLPEPGPTALHTRLQELAGESVVGQDGETVGVVRDIYQYDATGELAAITVVRRQLSSRSVLIPAAAIAPITGREADDPAQTRASRGREAGDDSPPHTLRLLVDAEIARAGMRSPVTGHATPQDLHEAAVALGLATEEPPREVPSTEVPPTEEPPRAEPPREVPPTEEPPLA